MCVVAPDVAAALKETCERAGLVCAVDWPLMACPASAVVTHAKAGVVVQTVLTQADARDMAAALAGAVQMPLEAVLRAVPLETAQVPGIGVYLARVDGRVASTVTTTPHDRIVGIWAMATLPEQGEGVGRVLLSQVMDEQRRRGAEAFFLGATPTGRPLYEKLGYRTLAGAEVWVRGETHQA